MSDIKVEKTMSKGLVAIKENYSILNAIKMMKKYDVGRLPVLDSNNSVVGILTDRDIIRLGVNSTGYLAGKVCDIMTRSVITITADDTVPTALNKMAKGKVKSLVVVDKDNKLVGMFGLSDALRAIAFGTEVLQALRAILGV